MYAVRLPDASDCIEPRIKCGGGNRNHGGYDAAFRVRAGQYTGDDAAECGTAQKERAGKAKVRSAEEQHIIDRAKSLLIERNHMTESEAHRYMQKCSMDSGTNLVETAQMVLTLLTE